VVRIKMEEIIRGRIWTEKELEAYIKWCNDYQESNKLEAIT